MIPFTLHLFHLFRNVPSPFRRAAFAIFAVFALGGAPLSAAVDASFGRDGRWERWQWEGESLLASESGFPWSAVFYDLEKNERIVIAGGKAEGFHVRLKAASEDRAEWEIAASEDAGGIVAHVEVSLKARDGRLEARFKAHPASARYEVERFSFPEVPVKHQAFTSAIFPIGLGLRYDRLDQRKERKWDYGTEPLTAVVRSRYPSRIGSLQMQIFERENRVLLCHTPDPRRSTKEALLRNQDGRNVLIWMHYPDRRGAIDDPYPVVFQSVEGDWYDAAQRYRSWALAQSWSSEPISGRSDIPAWFRDLPGWLRISRGPALKWEEKVRWPLEWVNAVGGPLGVHWYGWDELTGPNEYRNPDLYPPHPDLLSHLPAYEEAGIHIMPYINARLISPDSKAWEQLKSATIRDRAGAPAGREIWWDYCDQALAERAAREGRKHRQLRGGLWHAEFLFDIGDPGNSLWQQNLIERNQELARYGFPAMYQDQVNADPLPNFDPEAPRSARSSTHWQEGTEKIYTTLRKELTREGKTAPLVSEYIGENLIPFIQGGLTVGRGVILSAEHLPLFPAVYHTHFFTIGWPDNPHDIDAARQRYGVKKVENAKANPDLYFHQRMVPLVYGSQIGWIAYVTPQLIRTHPELVAAYRKAVDLRRSYPEYLAYGKMLRVPGISGVPQLTIMPADPDLGIATQRDFPVLGGFFQSASRPNRALALFVNWTQTSQNATARLDLSELGGRTAQLRPAGAEDTGAATPFEGSISLSLPPYGIAAYLIETHE